MQKEMLLIDTQPTSATVSQDSLGGYGNTTPYVMVIYEKRNQHRHTR